MKLLAPDAFDLHLNTPHKTADVRTVVCMELNMAHPSGHLFATGEQLMQWRWYRADVVVETARLIAPWASGPKLYAALDAAIGLVAAHEQELREAFRSAPFPISSMSAQLANLHAVTRVSAPSGRRAWWRRGTVAA